MNSSRKGSTWERIVCRRLSLWISDGDDEDVFWRTHGSGGRATRRGKMRGKSQLQFQQGDIGLQKQLSKTHPAIQFLTKFVVEIKFYKDLHLADIVYHRRSLLLKFWRKLIIESYKYKKNPMLIAKQNNYPAILCLDHSGLSLLSNVEPCNLDVPKWIRATSNLVDGPMYVALFDNFLESLTWPMD